MPDHMLTRDATSWPVCSCGFKPIYEPRSPGAYPGQRMVRAKIAVNKHIDQVTDLPHRPPSVSDPDEVGAEPTYPRASVTLALNGLWKITWWETPGEGYLPNGFPIFWQSRTDAFDQAWLAVKYHREAGTGLNGMAVA